MQRRPRLPERSAATTRAFCASDHALLSDTFPRSRKPTRRSGTGRSGGGESLPAVVNIDTERVVRRTVRDPFDDFYAQFFGYYRSRPREIRQTLQSLGSGFIVDPAGYIVTNQHVVERAADLKIQVTTNDDKTYKAHYITGDDKKDLAFIKIDAKEPFPIYQSR